MSSTLGLIRMYLSHDFVVYALIVGVSIALCAAMVGVTLVLKRYSFIGDGLSHVAFGAMTIGTILHISSNLYITLPVTVLAAVILLRSNRNSKVMGDAKLAILSVVSLAFGYLLMNVFSASANVSGDVCTTLFGSTSILTLTSQDVVLCLTISVLVIIAFIFLYNRLFAVTFDEEYTKATGTKTDTYNLIIAIIIAVIIVLGMNLVGSLLISALIIFPALSAMCVFGSFKSVTICSVVISIVAALTGMFISILGGTPVGATIVTVDAAMYLVFIIIGKATARG
ncbi:MULTISPECIES: metal ABC transporter permease [Mogibacterium]|uniref:ABC 3 transport family protein n=2 Tax=Mogibacterium timidum TaxID=35519 RepID=X8ITI9_9FIRM|nr:MULTISPECIES: metal ABC transporter permease [Mogibacterium]EUC53443.1 ABC 3 transport family protein [Mogibacterium timidum ATCC 33093]NWO23447.1 metal ABC transporter permease [Mogibacterium timidum]